MQSEAERLIQGHVGHVRRLAWGFHFGPDGPFSRDDLVAAGLERLVECAHEYDPALQSGECKDAFWAFAYVRIRGAMQDALRSWFHWDRRAGESPEPPWSLDEALRAELEPAVTDPPSMLDLWEAVGRLPEREAQAVVRHAFGEYETEIGASMGVSGSRVSQLKRQAHQRFVAWEYV